VPFPKDKDIFWKLAILGTKLRGLHLLDDAIIKTSITTYPISGSNKIDKVAYKNGDVYINDTQYIGGVPIAAWTFWIGGYQPVQKYLKDRKGKVLTSAELENYEKMIVALTETSKVMDQIDEILK
jgi:hypothetical protein